MIKKYSINYSAVCLILDALFVVAALRLAKYLRPYFQPYLPFAAEFQTPQIIPLYLYIMIGLIWVITFLQLGFYNPEKNLRVIDEVYTLIIGTVIAITIVAGLFYFVEMRLSRLSFSLFSIIAPSFLFTYRSVYRLTKKKKNSKGKPEHRLLVVGAGVVGQTFKDTFNKSAQFGYELIGFVDDNPEVTLENPDVLGTIDDIVRLVKTHHVDHLVIALPNWAHERISNAVEAVHKLPVRVWVIPDYFSLIMTKSSVWHFTGIPMIDLRAPALNSHQRLTKRVFDLALTIPLFLLALPLFGFIALLIKLDSEGPVLYHSPRLGENAETFNMLKFRTMIPDAHQRLGEVVKKDENGALNHKAPDDPRVTRMGKILRKTSLDEIPQLINILRGEMSLIGPRPELPELVALYKPWQYKRFAVPQGLTGWWQINGRSDKPMHLHTEEDLYYIQHYSVWFDIQILIKTILVVLRGKGAY